MVLILIDAAGFDLDGPAAEQIKREIKSNAKSTAALHLKGY